MVSVEILVKSKTAGKESLQHLVYGKFAEAEFDRLVEDWKSYKSSSSPAIGRYTYKSEAPTRDKLPDRTLVISFDILGAITEGVA